MTTRPGPARPDSTGDESGAAGRPVADRTGEVVQSGDGNIQVANTGVVQGGITAIDTVNIVLPTDDRRSRGSRDDLLLELAAIARGRMVARWQAAGVSASQAVELADDPTIGVAPSQLAELPSGAVGVLEGHLGMGKTLLGLRRHQRDIQHARHDDNAPIPVWLDARTVAGELHQRVLDASVGLGDPSVLGATIVIDGLDESGGETAAELIDQARALVHRWPATRAVLTTRPGPPITQDERIEPSLLSLDEADRLIQRIAQDDTSLDFWLWRWPEPARDGLRESVRTPLFAVIVGVLRHDGQADPSRGLHNHAGLLEHLADRGLRAAARGTPNHTEQTLHRLLCRLAVETTRRGGRVPLAELGDVTDQEAVLSSRLVARQGAMLAFPLPVLEQWFAAHALLNGLIDIEAFSDDLRQLEPWRWPLTVAARIGGHEQVSRLLAPVASCHPGLAGWIVHEAVDDRWREPGSEVALLPDADSAREVRQAMQAWVAGLGRVFKAREGCSPA